MVWSKIVSPVERIGTEKDSVMVLKVDVDENEVASECNIDCMPTFLFYKNQSLKNSQIFRSRFKYVSSKY